MIEQIGISPVIYVKDFCVMLCHLLLGPVAMKVAVAVGATVSHF